MTTLFVTAGDISFGSSRMRAFWPAEYMDARVTQFKDDGPLPDADVYIFQKSASGHVCKSLRDSGAQVWWDVCDPSWWFQPDECRAIVQNVDGIAASNKGLLHDLMTWMADVPIDHEIQAHVIPDRLELSHFSRTRYHHSINPVRLIWYGVAANRVALHAAIPTLERLAINGYDFELTIFDNAPDKPWVISKKFNTYHTLWSLERENDVLSSHDTALLPPYPGAWGGVKSNNKNVTAWANGLPATQGVDYCELEELMDWRTRNVAAKNGRSIIEKAYDVRQSAQQWQELLCAS